MKIRIDEYCVRCGMCIDLAPELFARDIEKDCIEVLVSPVPEKLWQQAVLAARNCAVTAIKLREWDRK